MTQQQFQKKPQSTTVSTLPELLQSRPFEVESTATITDVQGEGFAQNFAEMAVRSPRVVIQPKLTIGQPGDKYEQEADRVAAEVVQKLDNPPSAQKPLQIQTKPGYSGIERVNSLVQRQPDIGGDTVNDEFESSLNNARSGGQGLEPQLRMKMESAMGTDFSRVKVHTDGKANRLNQSIQAKAFTTGQDIFFRQGEYNPGNKNGQQLIAHELTHVVQQGGSAAVQGLPQPEEQEQQHSANDSFLQKQSHQVVQRAVPKSGATFKPKANTGNYKARGGEDVPFNSAQHTRARFGFGVNTRYEVFSRFNPTMQGNRIVSIRASNGEQVNVEGIQLDHQISWDRISAEMDRKNGDGSGEFYSFWDAKMYYNDIDNLVPALGALNAAAGAEGVAEEPRQNHTIEAALGSVQHSWMNLQNVMIALNSGNGFTQISDEEMVNILLDINLEIGGLIERLMNG